jgi:uncharacterized membrane protein
VALEQSVVFRQLEAGGRFSRFDFLDLVLVLVPHSAHYLIFLCAGWPLGTSYITLLAAAVAIYLFRSRFPEGVGPVLHVLLTPHHLSAMAEDQVLRPYPAAPPEEARP